MDQFKKFLPHLLVLAGFVILSLFYFSPVLQGKQIFQSDIVQYIGMSKQQNDFREQTGEETYWTDAAFGGMPTFQLGAKFPHNYVKNLDLALRFLPRPADYLFLYFIGFYILLLCMRLNWKLAFLGSLAFGFSTYLIIILGVGHNAKAHAIAYMPLVLAGIIAVFRNRNMWSFLLLTVAMALEIQANHFQMTYYLLLLVVILGVAYLVDAFRKGMIPNFFKSIGVMVVAVVIAIAANATLLLSTQEYTAHSTRGKTGLTINPDGTTKEASGLSFDYITQYSYGIWESFDLFIPRFMGGGNSENVGTDSNIYNAIIKMGASPAQATDFAKNAPLYWGDQPIVAAPAYIGASVIFLFIFALFLVRGRLKWWIVGASILALMLSWGKNFSFLTEFFIEYVPLYNKFRAISSIQVIIELCVPLMAIFGLSRLFSEKLQKEEKLDALKWTGIITGGILLLFLLFKSILFDFAGASDSYYRENFGLDFMRALKDDRKAVFTNDILRSLLLVGFAVAGIWAYLNNKLKKDFLIAGFAILFLADLLPVDFRYVNKEDFVNARVMNQPYQQTQADAQILQDNSHYRVFDVSGDPFNSGRASYFHNALGGYHAAKPGRMQDIYDFYISQNDMDILNMLNVKYFIIPTQDGAPQAQQNPEAFGNAWLVNKIQWVPDANTAIQSLKETDLQKVAVIESDFKPEVSENFSKENTASIQLETYQPDHLTYRFQANSPQFAVFSETYYQPGWNAYIDGNPASHVRVDYLLRGMNIPAGDHTIEFKFEPAVIQTGGTITMISAILIGLILLGGIGLELKKRR
ncbi:MAG: YfhO family protein [Christiangramia sp.]|uniref:YfhO family protein n=1 Tax=Christiangramia sp. TaxID=1931228 RepID=UPI0032428311